MGRSSQLGPVMTLYTFMTSLVTRCVQIITHTYWHFAWLCTFMIRSQRVAIEIKSIKIDDIVRCACCVWLCTYVTHSEVQSILNFYTLTMLCAVCAVSCMTYDSVV